MTLLEAFDLEIAVRFTKAAAHFLWQGTLIAFVAFVLEKLFERRSARLVYAVNLTALCLLAICLPANWMLLAPEDLGSDIVTNTAVSESPITSVSEANAIPVEFVQTTSSETVGNSPQVATASEIPWEKYTPILMFVYAIGVLIFLVRLFLGIYGGRRLRRTSKPIENRDILDVVAKAVSILKMSVRPTIAYCDRVVCPAVVGIVKPVILIPISMAAHLSPSQLEAVILHELAHLKRYDHLVLLFQRLVEAVLFFHPATWWLSHRVSKVRELCCDDLVLKCGTEPADYAETLVRFSQLQNASAALTSEVAMTLAADGGNRSQLSHRVLRILGSRNSIPVKLNGAGFFAVLTVLGLAMLLPFAMAQENVDKADEELIDNNSSAEPLLRMFSTNPPIISQLYFERFLKRGFETLQFPEVGDKYLVRWQTNGFLLVSLSRFPALGEDPMALATSIRGVHNRKAWNLDLQDNQLYMNYSELLPVELNESQEGLRKWASSVVSPALYLGIPNVTREAVQWNGTNYYASSPFYDESWRGSLIASDELSAQITFESVVAPAYITGKNFLDLGENEETRFVPREILRSADHEGNLVPVSRYWMHGLILAETPLSEDVFFPYQYMPDNEFSRFIVTTNGNIFKLEDGKLTPLSNESEISGQDSPNQAGAPEGTNFEEPTTHRVVFQPEENSSVETSWTKLSPSEIFSEEEKPVYVLQAQMTLGGSFPVVMEGEEEKRFIVTMVEGNDEELKLLVQAVGKMESSQREFVGPVFSSNATGYVNLDVTLKRNERKRLYHPFRLESYYISYPSTEVALDQPNISETADVSIFFTPSENPAVRIQVSDDKTLTFGIVPTTWEELPDLLKNTSERQNLILELALEEDVLLSDVAEHISGVRSLSEELGFKDFSIMKGDPSESKEFDGAVPLETATPQGTVGDEASLRTESSLLSGLGAWVGAEVPSQRVSIQVADAIKDINGAVIAHLAITNTSPVKIDITHRAVIYRQEDSWVRDYEMGAGLSFLGTLLSAPGSQSKATSFELEPGEGKVIPITPVQLSQPFILEFVCFAEERGLFGRRNFGQSIFVTTSLIEPVGKINAPTNSDQSSNSNGTAVRNEVDDANESNVRMLTIEAPDDPDKVDFDPVSIFDLNESFNPFENIDVEEVGMTFEVLKPVSHWEIRYFGTGPAYDQEPEYLLANQIPVSTDNLAFLSPEKARIYSRGWHS